MNYIIGTLLTESLLTVTQAALRCSNTDCDYLTPPDYNNYPRSWHGRIMNIDDTDYNFLIEEGPIGPINPTVN